MEFLASIIDTVFPPLKDYVARTVSYTMSYADYIDLLVDKMSELKSKRDDIQRMVAAALKEKADFHKVTDELVQLRVEEKPSASRRRRSRSRSRPRARADELATMAAGRGSLAVERWSTAASTSITRPGGRAVATMRWTSSRLLLSSLISSTNRSM